MNTVALAERIDTPEGRASLSVGDIRQLLASDTGMGEWTPEELADLRPDALAGFLGHMEYPAMQAWIDDAFAHAEQHREQRLFSLAWRANDVAQLLKHGTAPEEIACSPYAGITTRDRAAELEATPEADEIEGPPENRFQLLTPEELAALPPLRWRVRGVLPDTGLGAIYGPSGTGKTFLVLDLLAGIAAGRLWFGRTVQPCPCVYVALEGEAGIAQRVQAFVARNGKLEGLRVVLSPLDIRERGDRLQLAAAIKAAGFGGGVLCLDTLNRAAPGADENDSREMGRVIEAMKALQADLGGLVLVVHHSGKDQTRGLRGHSSLLAALDVVLEVSRNDDRRQWSLAKAKDGTDEEAAPFRLEVVELGNDPDGWPISSCVVQPEDTPAEAVRKAKLPGGGNQRIAWDAIGPLLKDSKHFGQGQAPMTRPCLRLDDALAAIAPRLTCDQKRKAERAQQAITGLINRGCLEHYEGWLWLP